MNVNYSAGVKLLPAARQETLQMVSAQLAGLIAPRWSAGATASWEYSRDFRGRDLYRLTLQDDLGRVSTEFTGDELNNPTLVKVLSYRLWGDLLQIRSDLQFQKLDALIPEPIAG